MALIIVMLNQVTCLVSIGSCLNYPVSLNQNEHWCWTSTEAGKSISRGKRVISTVKGISPNTSAATSTEEKNSSLSFGDGDREKTSTGGYPETVIHLCDITFVLTP